MATRIGVIAIAGASVPRHLRYFRQMGVADRICAELALDMKVSDLADADLAFARMTTVGKTLRDAHGAEVEAITGDALLKQNFPAIHAVGRASHRAPRLVVLRWGKDTDPALVLVGKGVRTWAAPRTRWPWPAW
ncbi:hypothetical protein G6F40_015416 [Rhizopus arrhizus]|nr:hypothetical protein G6F40_015416 [Rhizopus arrhizus]